MSLCRSVSALSVVLYNNSSVKGVSCKHGPRPVSVASHNALGTTYGTLRGRRYMYASSSARN